MAIDTTVPSWTGMLPQATPAMNPGQVSQMRGQEISNMNQMLTLQERLKDIENAQKERELKSEQLDFEKQNVQARMQEKRAQERINFRNQQKTAIVNDMDTALQNEQSYMDVWNRHKEQGSLPQDLVQKDGTPVPYSRAKTILPRLRKEAVNTVEQQQRLDLARLNIAARLSQMGFSDVNTTSAERATADNTVSRLENDMGWDLGSADDALSDRSYLRTFIAEATTMFQRAQADRGKAYNADDVRERIVSAIKDSDVIHSKNSGKKVLGVPVGWALDIVGANEVIDRPKLNAVVNKALGFESGKLGSYMTQKYGSDFTSGPVGILAPDKNPASFGDYPKFDSVEELQSAVESGDIKNGDIVFVEGKKRKVTITQ